MRSRLQKRDLFVSENSLYTTFSMVYPSNFYTIIIEIIIINDADSIIMGVQTMSTGTDPADAQ